MPGRLQINLEFKSSEDRLLLKISEKGNKGCVEYRLWLTRRFVIIFLRAIEKILEDDSASDMQVSPEAQEAMKKFKQKRLWQRRTFQHPLTVMQQIALCLATNHFSSAS